MDAKKQVEETLKQLEKEIVQLENAQVELMRKKWALETKLEKQQHGNRQNQDTMALLCLCKL